MAIPKHTVDRDRACRLALAGRIDEAKSVAREIEPGWFRCQAWAHIAAHAAPGPEQDHAVKAALTAAAAEADGYKRTAALAWPVAALVKAGERERASRVLDEALTQADAVTPDASRAETLVLLLQAGFGLSPRHRAEVVKRLHALASGPRAHWRSKRGFRDAMTMIATASAEEFERLLADLPDEAVVQPVRRHIENGERVRPRSFV